MKKLQLPLPCAVYTVRKEQLIVILDSQDSVSRVSRLLHDRSEFVRRSRELSVKLAEINKEVNEEVKRSSRTDVSNGKIVDLLEQQTHFPFVHIAYGKDIDYGGKEADIKYENTFESLQEVESPLRGLVSGGYAQWKELITLHICSVFEEVKIPLLELDGDNFHSMQGAVVIFFPSFPKQKWESKEGKLEFRDKPPPNYSGFQADLPDLIRAKGVMRFKKKLMKKMLSKIDFLLFLELVEELNLPLPKAVVEAVLLKFF